MAVSCNGTPFPKLVRETTISPFLVGCMAGSVHSVSFQANEPEHTQKANRIGWFTNQMHPYIKQQELGGGQEALSLLSRALSRVWRHLSLRWLVNGKKLFFFFLSF